MAILRRCQHNPILTRENIPAVEGMPWVEDVSSVFNPGALRWRVPGTGEQRDVLLLRVQTRGRETVLMVAEAEDASGERWTVRSSVVEIAGIEDVPETVYHAYDPRLTQIGDDVFVVFAGDIDGACKLGMARTRDFETFELVTFGGEFETRNGVLFPEKVGGRYVRLERPNQVLLDNGVTTGSEIVLSESDDLVTWDVVGPVMAGRWHYWDEMIGSGPPPIKTREGWLHVYHGIAQHFASSNIYQAGVVLLDLTDPTKVIGRGRNNVLEPREGYELTGQVPNVVFPSGMIVDGEAGEDDGCYGEDCEVRVYYGAADTVVGMARGTVGGLLEEVRRGG
ncbi:MAG: hypothetical protein D8M59_13800 [Planctomycetes bacterium]|nr:hypothetical protein [Planctomycetota bacterium]NOG55581.1 hypothetical protein [Planctomycetota bacterium]